MIALAVLIQYRRVTASQPHCDSIYRAYVKWVIIVYCICDSMQNYYKMVCKKTENSLTKHRSERD